MDTEIHHPDPPLGEDLLTLRLEYCSEQTARSCRLLPSWLISPESGHIQAAHIQWLLGTGVKRCRKLTSGHLEQMILAPEYHTLWASARVTASQFTSLSIQALFWRTPSDSNVVYINALCNPLKPCILFKNAFSFLFFFLLFLSCFQSNRTFLRVKRVKTERHRSILDKKVHFTMGFNGTPII